MRAVVCLILSAVAVTCHKGYQEKIPNGDAVPNPCSAGNIWWGVGHKSPDPNTGKKARNAFGKEFKQANNTWTVEICSADSDGDGVANGVELGDPDCTWTEGAKPKKKAISHPGICEPDSAVCAGGFTCDTL